VEGMRRAVPEEQTMFRPPQIHCPGPISVTLRGLLVDGASLDRDESKT